jgi:glycine cleavage system regulatory protein
MERTISHKAVRIAATNVNVLMTPGIENLMMMHAAITMSVPLHTSSLTLMEDFTTLAHDAVRRLRLSLRPSFRGRGPALKAAGLRSDFGIMAW